MKEESHLQEMRAALRGDRERAQRRKRVDKPTPAEPVHEQRRSGFLGYLRRG